METTVLFLTLAVVVLCFANVVSLRFLSRERRRREFLRKVHIYSAV